MRSYGTSMAAPGRSLRVGHHFPTEEQFKSKPQYYIDQYAYDSAENDYTKQDKKALQEEVARLRDLQLRQGRVLSYIKAQLERTQMQTKGGLTAEHPILGRAKESVDFISITDKCPFGRSRERIGKAKSKQDTSDRHTCRTSYRYRHVPKQTIGENDVFEVIPQISTPFWKSVVAGHVSLRHRRLRKFHTL